MSLNSSSVLYWLWILRCAGSFPVSLLVHVYNGHGKQSPATVVKRTLLTVVKFIRKDPHISLHDSKSMALYCEFSSLNCYLILLVSHCQLPSPSGYCLWRCMFHLNKNCIIEIHKENISKRFRNQIAHLNKGAKEMKRWLSSRITYGQ